MESKSSHLQKHSHKSSTQKDHASKSSSQFSYKQTQSDTDSSISISYDSRLDSGYKSGEIISQSNIDDTKKEPSTRTVTPISPKEHVKFDSGLGSECFSLLSESDIFPEEDLKSKNIKEKVLCEPIFPWQEIYNQDQDGDTFLHLAVVEARSDVIFPLICQAPHPDFLDICNDLCQTPLHLAALTGKANIVRRLTSAGATLDIQDHHGNTALHIASRNGDLDCVKAIVTPVTNEGIFEAQCSYEIYLEQVDLYDLINLKNFEGQTCVHLAAAGGFKKVLECLYDYGADINNKDGKSGKTALHYAVETYNFDLVQILLTKCRANANMKNYAGRTPLHVAWALYRRNPSKHNSGIVELLKKHTKEECLSDTDSDSSSSEEGFHDKKPQQKSVNTAKASNPL